MISDLNRFSELNIELYPLVQKYHDTNARLIENNYLSIEAIVSIG